ncbi:hypothetical protein [Falsibacillus pallidus]|uniref:UPF0738 protein DFR59_101417 n=1 Tax=Falsibacillus pallidus TaxID=493781 RepID=A0A370GYP8_9BACI|nr:hypothetical protein [Falsibacillus pallidus]RDI47754.1 hypothetical protein DFR59_101417 [Falsibacillus pallidus]
MRKTLQLKNAEKLSNALILHSEEKYPLSELKPAGQLIVDSDAVAFVYLAETEEDYVYIYLPESVWGDMKSALDEQITIKAVSGDEELVLENIHEELAYLIENIEGNSNYGEEMVKKAESVFLSK